MEKSIVFVDLDGVVVDFESGIATVHDIMDQKLWEGDWKNYPGIFSRMSPRPGAIKAFEFLATHPKLDTYILSTAPWNNPSAWTDKLLWVKKHLGQHAYKRLILSHHKHLCVGRWLIDDRKKNGSEKFGGEHIHFGQSPFEDWPQVISYVREQLS